MMSELIPANFQREIKKFKQQFEPGDLVWSNPAQTNWGRIIAGKSVFGDRPDTHLGL